MLGIVLLNIMLASVPWFSFISLVAEHRNCSYNYFYS